ncbi:MAG TPA: NAD(+) diphosphatase [Roseiarcus sp.]|nr:NAD(+) diphosphatase [Roseiarcus sp.]
MNKALSQAQAPPRFGFAGNPLDRLSERREDQAFLAAARQAPKARAMVFARDMPILKKSAAGLEALFTLPEALALGRPRDSALLGALDDGAPVFADLLDDAAVELRADGSDGFLDKRVLVVPGRDDLALIDARSIAAQGLLAPPMVGVLAEAKSLLSWHARHRFCPNCGAPTRLAAAGWRRECDVCKAQHFPRTDPVAIMLAIDGDNCLLGRQPRFPKSMYSCLAGFIEPGETIEDAVRREIREEAGILCGAVSYLFSQPWPFPSSLMIGCLAEAATREIKIDQIELEDARWFSREEARSMLEGLHPDRLSAPNPMAIAHHILRAWVEET